MALLNKKTTLIHHITYMGLMAAINLVFIVLATYVPLMMFLLILLLPFASAIVSYYCLKRYYLIYAIASVGLCLILNISDTIYYVVPAIASGFIIGLLIEKKIHPFWMIMATTIINAFLTIAFIPLINLICHTDFVKTLLTIFKLEKINHKLEFVYLFAFVISLIQCSLTVFVLLNDAKKVGIEIDTRITSFLPYLIGLELSIIGTLAFALFYLPLAVLFLAITACFTVFVLIDLLLAKKLVVYLLLGAVTLVSMILFAVFYPHIQKPYGLFFITILPLLIGVLSFAKNYLINKDSNNKILL